RPHRDPDRGELRRLRPALGCPPHVRRRARGARGHLREAGPLGAAHAPQGLASGGNGRETGGPALRPHGHGRGAGGQAGRGPGQGRIQGVLLLRMGEEVAPGDRGAGGRVSALREDDGGVSGRRGREGGLGMSNDEKVSRREFLEKTAIASAAAAALPGLVATPAEASGVLERALALGIDYFDTAIDYGKGESETRVGRVMATRRKDVFLATK